MSAVLEFSGVIGREEFERLKWEPFKREGVNYIIGALTLPCGERFQSFCSLWPESRQDIEESKSMLMNILIDRAICMVDPYGNKPEERRRMEKAIESVRVDNAVNHLPPYRMMARSIDG